MGGTMKIKRFGLFCIIAILFCFMSSTQASDSLNKAFKVDIYTIKDVESIVGVDSIPSELRAVKKEVFAMHPHLVSGVGDHQYVDYNSLIVTLAEDIRQDIESLKKIDDRMENFGQDILDQWADFN